MQGHWHSKADFASFPTTQDHSILTLGRPSTIATKKGFSEEPKMAQPSWETNLLENPMLPTHLQAWSDQHEDVQVSLKLIQSIYKYPSVSSIDRIQDWFSPSNVVTFTSYTFKHIHFKWFTICYEAYSQKIRNWWGKACNQTSARLDAQVSLKLESYIGSIKGIFGL